MSINPTLNYLLARQHASLLAFSGSFTTNDGYLNCAGGVAGDGLPMPYDGQAMMLQVWDGSNVHEQALGVDFSQSDRISAYADYNSGSGTYTVYVRKNGVNTGLYLQNVAANTDLQAVVLVKLTENWSLV